MRTLQTLMNVVDFAMNIQQAIEAPRCLRLGMVKKTMQRDAWLDPLRKTAEFPQLLGRAEARPRESSVGLRRHGTRGSGTLKSLAHRTDEQLRETEPVVARPTSAHGTECSALARVQLMRPADAGRQKFSLNMNCIWRAVPVPYPRFNGPVIRPKEAGPELMFVLGFARF